MASASDLSGLVKSFISLALFTAISLKASSRLIGSPFFVLVESTTNEFHNLSLNSVSETLA